MSILSNIPWYIWWGLVLIVALIIYFKLLPDEAKVGTKKAIKKYWIFIAIAIAYYIFRTNLGFFTEKNLWCD